MSQNLNKIQLRAKVISILESLKSQANLSKVIFEEQTVILKEYEDKDSLFELLVKELNSPQDTFYMLIKAMMIETIPLETLKGKILASLTSKKITDQTKYQLIQVMKDLGDPVDYNTFFNYFDDPDSIIDYDTQKLLELAVINPETQIDFLDFLSSLPEEDQKILLESLGDDYQGDNLVNILMPVLYADFNSDILSRTIETIGETKSSIGLEPLKWVMENTQDDKVKSLAKKNLNMLKLAGANAEKAKNFYKAVLANSKVYKCFATVPDGHNNQGLLVSRQRPDNSIQMFALVINNMYGIVDCFGFNFLAPAEFNRILEKYSQNDAKLEIDPSYAKYLIDKAVNLSKALKESFSYEFVCWNILTKDIEDLQISPEDWVKDNLEVIKPDEDALYHFFNRDYLDKWFFTPSDNDGISKLTEAFPKDGSLDLDMIEKLISDYYPKIWDISESNQLQSKVLNTCYLLANAGKVEDANILYSMLYTPELINKLKSDIAKKSVYEYILLLKQNMKDSAFTTNIFRLKKEKSEDKLSLKNINEILKDIEMRWVE